MHRVIVPSKPNRDAVERRRAFFYAQADADVYDMAAELNTPLYGLLHDTVRELVRQHWAEAAARDRHTPFTFLDIGSGTGAESLPILQEFPGSRMVAFDLCQPMHKLFRDKATAALGEGAVAARCRFVLGDIASEEGTEEALLRQIEGWATQYDMILSALALHHLTTDEKRGVYHRIGNVLKPGGLFINADLFTFQAPTLARSANQFATDYIRKQFTDPDPPLRAARDQLGARARPMMEAWLDHYRNYNFPDPVEGAADAGWEGGDPRRGQAAMLAEAGFTEVGCPFRYWELGILWAKR